jgi:hypothetical protein
MSGMKIYDEWEKYTTSGMKHGREKPRQDKTHLTIVAWVMYFLSWSTALAG